MALQIGLHSYTFVASRCLYQYSNFNRPLRCDVGQPNNASRFPKSLISATALSNYEASLQQISKSLNVHMPSLVLSSFPAPNAKNKSLRGLRATKPIQKNETLVSVPSSSVLQVTTTSDEAIPQAFPIPREIWRTLPWYARLALMILDAKRDQSHPLHAWASLLPASVDTPYHWTDAELDQIQSDRIVALVREQRRSYATIYNRICLHIPTARLPYESFKWAVDCVRSRAFSGPLETAPFRARLRLVLFIAGNTFLWPLFNVLPLQNSINGLFCLFPPAYSSVLLMPAAFT